MGLKQNVISAFLSQPVRWVNFTFLNRMISPICYYVAASYVQNGRIKCATDANLTDRATYDPIDDVITARDNSFGETYWDEKSTLIHEGAHAILDCFYAGRDMNSAKVAAMRVVDDETIGYLAGAIYLLASKAGSLNGNEQGQPSYKAMKAAKPKLDALMAKPWSGCETMPFSVLEVKDLQAAIHRHEFYKNEWSNKATHNGLKRS
jgi:hypothetical protein